ncbi:MAG: YihY/virulence factor BrkB family protein [Chromatiales bacterium]
MRYDYRSVKGRFEDQIWGTADLAAYPWWRAWPIRLVRYVHAGIRDLAEGELITRAGSLAYTTLLSFVPLLAVSFSLLKGFGVHNQLQPALRRMLAPLGDKAPELTSTIVGFVENMNVGVLGALGLAMLVYTVVSTMQKIESAFNYSWRVTGQRTFRARFADYLSVLIVGPVLVFAALGITGAAANNSVVQYLAGIQPFGTVLEWLARLVPYLMIIGAFTFLYFYMPNTRVRPGSAFVGGVVAGVLWQSTGWGFAHFVAGSAQYTAVYSAFAGLVVFVIWIYVAWLILLIGADIAFYHQHPEHLSLRLREPAISLREREALALCVMKLIATRYYAGERGWTLFELARHLLLPERLLRELLEAFERAGLLVRTATREPGYLPSRPLDTTSLQDVLAAVRNAQDAGLVSKKLTAYGDVASLLEAAEGAAAGVLSTRTVMELAGDPASLVRRE